MKGGAYYVNPPPTALPQPHMHQGHVEDIGMQPNGSKAVDHYEPEEVPWRGGYEQPEDKSLWLRIEAIHLRLNPLVSATSVLLIVAFLVWTIIDDDPPFADITSWITEKWTWLYIGSQDIWAGFMIVLYFSKYSHLKLGKPGEEPDFPYLSWFTMLFAAGIGVGLFFFGVAEPVWHYDPSGGGNRYLSDPTIPDNTMAQIAINLTYFHWGIHGWVVYTLVGLILSVLAYREDLPMTMKTCFYPLMGDLIYSWIGDAIDIMSILATLFGVCTSLGMGVMQINTGLKIMFDVGTNKTNQVIIIWCITAVATLSTVSGVGLGIRRLSEVCFTVGCIIMGIVFFMCDPFFILNLYCQSIGYYLQWIIQLGFHCDAWEMLGPSDGAEDRGRFLPKGVETTDGPKDWMDWWTIFYWGWWIAWSPFVGMFIAKISRGRTIREFIHGTMTAPMVFSFFWFAVFGGAGIKMEREAAREGLCCSQSFNWTAVGEYATANENLLVAATDTSTCPGNICNDCDVNTLTRFAGQTYGQFYAEYQKNNDINVISSNDLYARLTCMAKENMWFELVDTYGDLGKVLQFASLIGICLYFITSSDSGSLVIDSLSANGDPDPPRLQRVFWALTEGACATALLVAGGEESLKALQAVSIAAGLPYTFILCFICAALWRAVKVTSHEVDPKVENFEVGYLDVLVSTNPMMWLKLLMNVVTAPLYVGLAGAKATNSRYWWVYTTSSAVLLLAFIGLYVGNYWIDGMWACAWTAYGGFCIITAGARIATRNRFNMQEGSPLEDLLAAFFYPFAALQLQCQLEADYPPIKSELEKEKERKIRQKLFRERLAQPVGWRKADLHASPYPRDGMPRQVDGYNRGYEYEPEEKSAKLSTMM